MSKFSIAFSYRANGEIEIDAKNIDEATKRAAERLEELRDLGMLNSPSLEEIVWSGDEVEVE